MNNYKKLSISICLTVLSSLLVTFLIYKYWNTSFPYGLYIDMSEIAWQLFAFVFLDGFTLIVTFVNLYNHWANGDKGKWKRNYISLKVALRNCLIIIVVAILLAFIVPSTVFKFFMIIMIPASISIFSGFGVELLLFKYYLKLA